MENIIDEVRNYVNSHIGEFHQKRIEKLKTLKLDKLLKAKNPYMYKAKDLNKASDVVENIAAAYMSSAEESIFGNWLEGLAIFVASKVYNGHKSAVEGVDLEMDKDGTHYIISVKSGPRWSNSSSMAALRDKFKKAMRIYHTSGNGGNLVAIEGCCYGQDNKTDTQDFHEKVCGQKFWELISGDSNLYQKIIEPLGTRAHEENQAYKKQYDKMLNEFTSEFIKKYCKDDYSIDWDKIVLLNSGFKPKKSKKDKATSD